MISRIAICGFLSFVFAAIVCGPSLAEPLETSAGRAFIFDVQTGQVIYDKGAREKVHPASMSKLMTIYMLFDEIKKGNLKLTDTLHVSEKAWSTQGSKMFVEINGDIKIEDLIRGIIVQSGNDACVVVAEGIAGSEEAFAQKMNEKAKQIGLLDSHFSNSSGLPVSDHLMSVRDLAILGYRLQMDFPEFYPYFSEKEFVWHGIKQGNRNPLLYRANSGVDGLKTGHTEEAGYGLVVSANRNNRRLIMVVHGLQGMQERADEAGRVLDWAYRTTENYKIITSQSPLADAPVWMGMSKTVPVGATQDVVATLQKDSKTQLSAKIELAKQPQAPIKAGTVLGQMVVTAGQLPPISVPVVALADVEELEFGGRIVFNFRNLLGGN